MMYQAVDYMYLDAKLLKSLAFSSVLFVVFLIAYLIYVVNYVLYVQNLSGKVLGISEVSQKVCR